MVKRNTGITEQERLQNEFTAFITTSLTRQRISYLKREDRRKRHTFDMDDEMFDQLPDDSDFVFDICETDALACALKKVNERERYVVLSRVLEEKSFEEIADKLGMKYKGVAAIYYRTIAQLRNILGGM